MASFSVACILIPNDAIDYSKGAIAGDNTTLICYINYFELTKMREIISDNKGSFSTVSIVDEILR